MSSEDQLRNLLRSSGEPSAAAEAEWQEFIRAAHRSRFVHRVAYVAVVLLLVVGGGAGVWAARELRSEESVPPAERGVVDPVRVPRNVPTDCPDVQPYEPSSDLGAVAFVRDGDLYRVDIRGEEVALVRGLGDLQYSVEWSPDGQWISFGGGLIVPAAGGDVCAPLGTGVSEPNWGAGNTLVGLRDGELVVGAPGRAIGVGVADRRIVSFALDETGQRAAIEADLRDGSRLDFTGAEIYTVDLATGSTERVLQLTDDTTPRIAGWSPDGEWILFWRGSRYASIDADGLPLEAVSADGGAPVRITETMVPRKDWLDWCGDHLVFTEGADRLETSGHDLAIAGAPDWTAERLTTDDTLSWYGPSCAPGGEVVVANIVADGARLSARRSITFVSVPAGEILRRLPNEGAHVDWRNPTQWSEDGTLLLAERRQVALPPSVWVVHSDDPDEVTEVASLGAEVEIFDSKALYDWHAP